MRGCETGKQQEGYYSCQYLHIVWPRMAESRVKSSEHGVFVFSCDTNMQKTETFACESPFTNTHFPLRENGSIMIRYLIKYCIIFHGNHGIFNPYEKASLDDSA